MNHAQLGALTLGVVAIVAESGAQTVTRGPYLQTPTPAGITVRWRTDVATTSRVAYGSAPGSLTQMADDLVPTTEHVVPVTGLSADTQYYYSVGSVTGALAGDDSDHYFRTPPTPGTPRPMRFWTFGDAGFTGADLDAVRDAYATFNGSSTADLLLLLGDNAYLQGTDTQYQAAVFDEHHVLLRTTPVWSIFGNHEALSSNSTTMTGPYFDMFSFPTAAEAGGVASGSEAYYSFDFGNVHVIVLDSEQAPSSPVTPMLTWLEADLQATTADWVIAAWHRPPYSRGLLHNSDTETNEINMRTYALPLLEDYGVDLVLCGHSHSYERSHLIDGHYGLSSTLAPEMVLDSGDGRASGDGAYRKESIGPTPHEGAVFVVAGSGSEVRNATLDHPVMEIGLLELGSLVVDVDGDTLSGTFVNSNVQTTDGFMIVKAPACPPSPRSGCTTGASGRLALRNDADDTRDRLSWKWRQGTLDAGQLGAPGDQTDLAVCLYDQSGRLLGGAVPHGADAPAGAVWTTTGSGAVVYRNKSAAVAGIRELRLRPGAGTAGVFVVKGRGAALGMPPLPVTLPVTAQLANLDGGACWESAFASAKRNGTAKVSLP